MFGANAFGNAAFGSSEITRLTSLNASLSAATAKGIAWPISAPNGCSRSSLGANAFGAEAFGASASSASRVPGLVAAIATGTVASVTANVRSSLAAVHATGAVNSFGLQTSTSLSLSAATASAAPGTLSAIVGPHLSASHGSGAIDSLAPSVAHSLSAAHGTGATGSAAFGIAVSGVHATGAVNRLSRASGVSGAAGAGAANVAGVKEEISLSGVHGTGAAGALTTGATTATVLLPAHGTGRVNQFGVSLTVSATNKHGKGKGHGKGVGPQSILRIELDDLAAAGRANALGFVVKSSTAITVGLVGVHGTGATDDLAGVIIDESPSLVSSVGTGHRNSVTAAVAPSLASVHATGNNGVFADRISPSPALGAMAAAGKSGSLALNIASGANIDAQLPSQAAFGRSGQFGIAISRELQQGVNGAVGAVGDVAREAIDASVLLGEAVGFSGVADLEFGINLSVALASIAAQGQSGRIGVFEILPQEGLTCDLHANVSVGGLGATANVNDLGASANADDLGASASIGTMGTQIKTNDLGAGLRCN
jgi:hypothetical protein